ncbi:hypothetical protein CROQUDRAFT_78080 [Cronartium quercuum f. sp. fusiforme G11]|uniref:Urease accessory protein UreD n=1 Tax=Cronartium quercuum f. sp. fusiforme G11 TaxID=708437 RepID=A0A9P6NFY0_9BASI|nr:hypothetical protein CROQUDRAFT_78080 [Cronartium quercuum f. sp. fusiforme G11]
MFQSPKLEPGHGIIHLSSRSEKESNPTRVKHHNESDDEGEDSELNLESRPTHFRVLSASYPLKLLTPRPYASYHSDRLLQAVYILNYGGGLVHGDLINLTIHLDSHTSLLALTQGSTKVFKDPHLLYRRPSPSPNSTTLQHPKPFTEKHTPLTLKPSITKQILTAHLASDSFLIMLPSPVTCFRDSNYSQLQRFHLSDASSSVIVLDWITSGRKYHKNLFKSEQESEHWDFQRYKSTNEFYCSSTLILRDTLTLKPPESLHNLYSIYLTLYIITSSSYNPKIYDLIQHFSNLNNHCQNQTLPPNRNKKLGPNKIIWSFSIIEPDDHDHDHFNLKMGILRVAGFEQIEVREWIINQLNGLVDLVGKDLFQNAF